MISSDLYRFIVSVLFKLIFILVTLKITGVAVDMYVDQGIALTIIEFVSTSSPTYYII